jgi:hypothetical protein
MLGTIEESRGWSRVIAKLLIRGVTIRAQRLACSDSMFSLVVE